MPKRPKKPNFLQGYKVVITQHVIDRYMQRAGVSEKEARDTLLTKFKNTRLTYFRKDGSEVRRELSGSLNKRLTFVAAKKGMTFHVITCYLQGPKDNYWKNEGLIVDDTPSNLAKEDIQAEITKEMTKIFGEA